MTINEKEAILQVIEDAVGELTAAEIKLNQISQMSYAELDSYVEANVTDLASAKSYLKVLSSVTLALIKTVKNILYK